MSLDDIVAELIKQNGSLTIFAGEAGRDGPDINLRMALPERGVEFGARVDAQLLAEKRGDAIELAVVALWKAQGHKYPSVPLPADVRIDE